jgi:hypothetical protein
MSWLSKTVDRLRNHTDQTADSAGMDAKAKKRFRVFVASHGGGMGMQYEYSRMKGMNSDEATKNSVTGGAQYSQTRDMQRQRLAEESQREATAELERKRIAEDTRARGQIAARIRRSARATRSDKGGTLLTGGLGTTGSNVGSFAAMLGL